MILRPFFSFFGAKWRAAKRYPPPTLSTIVEPFAGSAGYACHYPDCRVVLVEKDPVISGLWSYLIRVRAAEVRALPSTFDAVHDETLPPEARTLIGFWLNRGCEKPRIQPNSWARSGAWPMCFWGEIVRERIARQVDQIRHWKIIEGDYRRSPDSDATWFIDPPYEKAGRRYVESSKALDFVALGAWCRSRVGQVIACENVGATWLPFEPMGAQRGIGKRYSEEAIWTRSGAT